MRFLTRVGWTELRTGSDLECHDRPSLSRTLSHSFALESASPYINPQASSVSSLLPPLLLSHISPFPPPSMLDFDPFAPTHTTHVQDNDSLFRLQQMQADLLAYSPYSPPYSPAGGGYTIKPPLTPPVPVFASHPGPQSFNFDPFADEDSSTSSGASERERELEVQRVRRIEFLRRREWMRRVVAWVDGISHGMVSPSSRCSCLGFAPLTGAPAFVKKSKRDHSDKPCLIYRPPHYHRHPRLPQSPHIPLVRINIPRPVSRRTSLLSTTALAHPSLVVPTRTMGHTSFIVHPCPATHLRA